jgi:predicted RNA-binding Zn ribbon-like protein
MTTLPHDPAHAHGTDLDACLALVNTFELDAVPREHLGGPEEALAFFVDRGLGHEDALRRQVRHDGEAAWLERVRQVRAALREVFDAQVEARPPSLDALAALNGVLDRRPRMELRAAADGPAVAHRHADDDPTGEALARLAMPLVDAIAAGDTSRFRICANDACRWVFEDGSRAGRRRWCDMQTCGNRAKARRFRSRRKAATPDAGID